MQRCMNYLIFFSCLFTFSWLSHREAYFPTDTTPQISQKYYKLKAQNQYMLDKYNTMVSMLHEHFWTEDDAKIRRVAYLIVTESVKHDIDPHLIYGVLRVENPWLENWRVSHAGAVGVMQVMPRYWNGTFPECGDLYTLEGNMCYGVRILNYYLETTSTQRVGLLKYNGCTRVVCSTYADLVFRYSEKSKGLVFSVD